MLAISRTSCTMHVPDFHWQIPQALVQHLFILSMWAGFVPLENIGVQKHWGHLLVLYHNITFLLKLGLLINQSWNSQVFDHFTNSLPLYFTSDKAWELISHLVGCCFLKILVFVFFQDNFLCTRNLQNLIK